MKLRQIGLISLFVLLVGASVSAQAPSVPTLELPADGAVEQPVTAVTLWWSPLGSGVTYGLQVSTDPAFHSIFLDRRGLVERAYTLFQILSKNTTYYWRVNATIGGRTSDWSPARSFTTTNASIPAAPILISPANGETGVSPSPTLTWQAVPGATSYHIQISEHATLPLHNATIVESWLVLGTSFSPGFLPDFQEDRPPGVYYWRVRARNGVGLGEWSELRSFSIR